VLIETDYVNVQPDTSVIARFQPAVGFINDTQIVVMGGMSILEYNDEKFDRYNGDVYIFET